MTMRSHPGIGELGLVEAFHRLQECDIKKPSLDSDAMLVREEPGGTRA
jgi:hypothetical protein